MAPCQCFTHSKKRKKKEEEKLNVLSSENHVLAY